MFDRFDLDLSPACAQTIAWNMSTLWCGNLVDRIIPPAFKALSVRNKMVARENFELFLTDSQDLVPAEIQLRQWFVPLSGSESGIPEAARIAAKKFADLLDIGDGTKFFLAAVFVFDSVPNGDSLRMGAGPPSKNQCHTFQSKVLFFFTRRLPPVQMPRSIKMEKSS